MTLASICINVAQDLGIDEPAPPLIGSRLPAAKRLVAQARRALWSLVRRADFAPLVIEHEFTADGSSDYPLPPDFLSMINDTAWESTRYWAMRGALSPQQWQRYRRSIYGRATIWRRWRIRVASGHGAGTAPSFSIDPAVAGTDHTSQFVFEYRSLWAVRHPDGTMGADWTHDDDTAIMEGLLELGTRWRILRRMGLAYDEEKEEYDREIDKAVARSGGMSTLNLVPFHRDDLIGGYSLGAFPPAGAPVIAPHQMLPPDIGRLIAPMERPDWRPSTAWPGPPPLAPRVPPPPMPSQAEHAAALLARAPPVETPRPPVRRLRRRHQMPEATTVPPALVPPTAGSAAVPGTPHPIAATPERHFPPPPPDRQGWLQLDNRPGGAGPLRPRLPEPPLPPGT